ncbi:MAG: helix-turn-helix transcriptional regulator [Alphaproteobacteria bacterium]|jgi:transcriptional regulator with XRE-family HTH domain|nr:helix-turn-helix transcriptional regulator [Alphaproteobacteria bacterium]MBT7942103.1 helix-turn-helix transcriptional regulator [Alphaproteobacteria bacterium]
MNTFAKDISHLQGVIAKNVKNRRLQMGLSQEEFADLCGYHRTYIGSIERSERNITVSTLEALAGALEVDAAELLRDDG